MPVKPKNDPMALRLRRIRLKLGWSQSRMGEYLGVHRITISTWEENGPPARGPSRNAIDYLLKRLLKHEGQKRYLASRNEAR